MPWPQLLIVALCLWSLSAQAAEENLGEQVQTLFQSRCTSCHGAKEINGGLRLDRGEAVRRGGDSGAAMVAKDAKASLLFHRITSTDSDLVMPPEGDRLTAEQIELVRRWIDAGADWPKSPDDSAAAAESNWWAIQPLKRPSVPAVDSATLLHPIDSFVRAKLQEAGLQPSPRADRRTLMRRVYLDLTGLPPTWDELAAFEADQDPKAFEKLVDQLLASPGYGERWARHWLDVVHFAETHGHDQDRPRDNAWPYRDYVIQALNADKPYGRFVEEQVAADALYPDQPELIPALGFLSAGPWDESSLRDIREDTLDRQIGRYLDRDDIITNVMGTFTSTTVHCARCHFHKFDPISQEDYYCLQAVFAGAGKGTRQYDPDPAVASRRATLLGLERSLKEAKFGLPADLRQLATQWEESQRARPAHWRILSSPVVTSQNGSTITSVEDGSYRVSGASPEIDLYTVTAVLPPEKITAIRLEVLPDDSLAHKGPGRQDNGNLHLSEFRVTFQGEGEPAEQPVQVSSAFADFDQAGWDVLKAIDGNQQTAWGIYPEVGKPHSAVFRIADNAAGKAGTWKFLIDQHHGGRHTIGRFRIAVSSAEAPDLSDSLTEAHLASLGKAAEERTPAEQQDLDRVFLQLYIKSELAKLPALQLVYSGSGAFMADGGHQPPPTPRPVHLLQRGEITKPLKEVGPGALSCLPDMPSRFQLPPSATEADRRAALARWLSGPRNSLTWRSIVNRVWHYHFGKGIVDTPNDLGKMAGPNSNPELLDWLAVEFRDGGGSLKSLHRMILLSDAWQQTVRHDDHASEIDGGNTHLWRMNRSRLDAEVVRDALLQFSGRLDLRMGGPSDRQFLMSPGIHVTPKVDYVSFSPDAPANNRRSIYRFLFRTLPDPLMDALDCPAGDQQAPVRTESVTALQAFALLNNPFVIRQSELIAERIASKHSEPAAQIAEVYRLILLRSPTPEEASEMTPYLAVNGLSNVCRLLVNCNEFLYVD
jgi:mono/diheme cytochrome c family protein